MLSNKSVNDSIYDTYFLEQTFNSAAMLKFSNSEISWLINELKLNSKARIIDVACGSGRHLKAFTELGYSPVGVDTSSECIRLAKQNCKLPDNNIVQNDLFTFSEENCENFDVVFIAGGSFGYDPSLAVIQAQINSLLKMVAPFGYIVIQFLNKTWAKSTITPKLSFWIEDEEKYILDKRELKNELLYSEKTFIKKQSNFQRTYKDIIHLFTVDELVNLISASVKVKSFTLLNIKDSFSTTEYNEDTSASPVLIFHRIK